MKTPNLFKLILLGLLISSCDKKEDDSVSLTAITLSTISNTVIINSQVTFTVKGNNDNDLTTSSAFKVDNVSVSNPYSFASVGTYQVIATNKDLTSNTLTVTVEDLPASDFSDTTSFEGSGAPSSFTKKVLLENFTGTWANSAPVSAAAIKKIRAGNSNIFSVGYHSGANTDFGPDPMIIPQTSSWSSFYNIKYYPTVYANGPDTILKYPSYERSQVDTELAEIATVGLAVETALIGGKLDIEVKVGFKTTPSDELKLMIYLVEDDVKTSTPQEGSDLGFDYVHKDVLRKVYTGQFGDNIITVSRATSGGVFKRTITGLDLPTNVDNVANLKVIAFVRNTYKKTFTDKYFEEHIDSPHYDIYNVQQVKVGKTKDFD